MALPIDNEVGLQDENNNLTAGDESPLVDPVGTRVVDLIDVNSYVAIKANQRSDPENNIHGGTRPVVRNTQYIGEDGINLRMIFEMLQAQQVAIAQLQSQTQAPRRVEPGLPREVTHKRGQL